VATLGDMLSDRDREYLERMAEPDVQDLAPAARDAARESTGTGRVAWSIVAMALEYSGGSAECARGIVEALVHDERVRHLAQACLTTIYRDDDTTPETT
jgi:hypothetical protein